MTCFIKGCKNVRRLLPPDSQVSFHRFPKDKDSYKAWLIAIGEESNLEWKPQRFICSEHFEQSDLQYGVKMNRPTAAPKFKLSLHTHDILEQQPSAPDELNTAVASTSKSCSPPLPRTPVQSCSKRVLVDPPDEELYVPKKKKKGSKSRNGSKVKGSGSSGTSSSLETKRKRYRLEHSYNASPGTMKREAQKIKSKLNIVKKQVYKAKSEIKKLKRKITSLKDITNDLKTKHVLSSNAIGHLEQCYSNVPAAIMQRILQSVGSDSLPRTEYPPELKKFAVTLHFYSAKAYNYVRQSFCLALPHPSVIRRWSSSIECNPGFSAPCLKILQKKVDDAKNSGKRIICSLMLDEMAIKKQIDFDGKRNWGFVDIGVDLEDEEVEAAYEVLVLMVVCLNAPWKLPIAYFFITSMSGAEKANIVNSALIQLAEIGIKVTSVTCDGPTANFSMFRELGFITSMSGAEKANIVNSALIQLAEIGIKVTSVTCDGPTANFSMFRELGCDFSNKNNMKTYFIHPTKKCKVYAIFDACHMIKLFRNCLSDLQVLVDEDGKEIKWEYINKLYVIQETETLSLANKLRKAHMQWRKQKMKVKLAAQTLSNSVAEALMFLSVDMQLAEFQGCEATVKFITCIDALFDIMNSRLPWAKRFKAPLKPDNEIFIRGYILHGINYITNLKDVRGTPLLETQRKTAFIGFIISLKSVLGIYDDFVETGYLKYLLTYKLSQDHLELFFCSVRSRNGWNNNPTSLQFMRTYRKLLLHADVRGQGGNCQLLEATNILHVEVDNSQKTLDILNVRKFDIPYITQEHDYDFHPEHISLSEYAQNVVTYMAGYVVKMMEKLVHCCDCIDLLTCMDESESNYRFVKRQNLGGYFIPSPGIVKISYETELFIRKVMYLTNNCLPSKNLMPEIVATLSRQLIDDLNKLFKNHEEHSLYLLKLAIQCYCKIRLHNLAKMYTEKMHDDLIRKSLSKLILFKHQ